jgi:thiol-disulfide isomerase/thioredoxin
MLKFTRRQVGIASLLALSGVFAAGPSAAQTAPAFAGRTVLIMVDAPDCIYCRRWERDVEEGYRNSAEGRFAPLEKRDRRHADLQGLQGLRYTPTFIVLVDGREVGRITGYPGADFFWGEITAILKRNGFRPEDAPVPGKSQIET